jgi:hydrogenase maturation protease
LTTTVLGLGNILLKDEGVGVHAVNAIKGRYSFPPDVEVIDGGTLGLDLLPLIEKRDRLLFVDAVDFGKEPGYIGIVDDDAIPSTLLAKMSVHHIGLSDVLFAAKLLDIKPVKIRLVGIQPLSLEVGLEMTDCISGKLEEVIAMVINTLKEWNVECALRSPQKLSA